MKRVAVFFAIAAVFLFSLHTARTFLEQAKAGKRHGELVEEAEECLDAKHWKCAERAVSALLAESPDDTNLQMHLAGILFEQGRYAEVKAYIDSLPFSHPDLKFLREKSALLLKEETELRRENSAHFRLELEGELSRIETVEALNVLEIAYDSLAGLFGFFPEDKIAAVLYSRESLQKPEWAFAVYDGKLRIPAAAMQDRSVYRPVLFHELTHAFVKAMSRAKIPTFANEGVAQLIDASKRGLPRPEGKAPSLEELSRPFAGESDRDKVEKLYWYSLRMVEILFEEKGQGAFTAFRDFLFDLKGLGTDASLHKHFGTTSGELYEKALR